MVRVAWRDDVSGEGECPQWVERWHAANVCFGSKADISLKVSFGG
jgi:hypothetical protein